VTLRASCAGLVFPSKLYGATGAGRPVLGVAPLGSSLGQEIIRHKLGACFERENPAGMARQLLHWRDHPHELAERRAAARVYHATRGDAEAAVERWGKLLFPAGLAGASLSSPAP
jgi:colanic acid biosynthesis glycosyl transferase WcaI